MLACVVLGIAGCGVHAESGKTARSAVAATLDAPGTGPSSSAADVAKPRLSRSTGRQAASGPSTTSSSARSAASTTTTSRSPEVSIPERWPPSDPREGVVREGRTAIELVADRRDVDTSKRQQVTFRLANRGEVDVWVKPNFEVHRWTGQRWQHVWGRDLAWAAVVDQVEPGESTDPQTTPTYNPKHDYELRTSWYRIVKSATYNDPEKDTSTTLTAVAHFYLHE